MCNKAGSRMRKVSTNFLRLTRKDWSNIMFMVSIFLVVSSKPISFISEFVSIGFYLVGLFIFIVAIILSERI